MRHPPPLHGLCRALLLLLVACAVPLARARPAASPPPAAWQPALETLLAASGDSGIDELVIVHQGRTLYQGSRAGERHGVWSCTKSFVSTALGLLVDDGKVTLETRVASLLPVLEPDYPSLTLRHLVTMSSGYSAIGDSPRPDGYAHGPSETPFLPGPPRFAPGSRFEYWDSAMNLLAWALTEAAGETLDRLLRRRIVEPLGLDPAGWHWGAFAAPGGQAVNSGAGNHHMLELSAVNLARFGQLLLQQGQWEGRTLLSRSWIETATRPHIYPTDGRAPYGFNWWCLGELTHRRADLPDVPRGTYAASGYNNNKLIVVPEWELVVVRLGLDQRPGRISDATWARVLRQLGAALGHGVPPVTGRGEVSIREVVPLDRPHRQRLRELVQGDAEARALFVPKQEQAHRWRQEPPRALAEIHYEGLVHTDPRRLATVEKLQAVDDVANLLEVWQVSEEAALAGALRGWVLAWATTYRPTGNDVNEDKLMPLFVAYASLRDTFGTDERRRVDAWLERLAELHQAEADDGAVDLTNRQAKRLRLAAALARALGREDHVDEALARAEAFINQALRADGTSHDLAYRDALSYHCSTLVPLVDLAIVAQLHHGARLYPWVSLSGGSLQRSVDYVLPFARGQQTRAEWRQTQVDLDRRRAAAGLPQYQPGRLFDPWQALPLLEAAGWFDPSLRETVAQLRAPQRRYPSWRWVVNATALP